MNEINKEILSTGWNFENSYLRLPETFFRNILPEPVKSPKIAILNNSLAEYLGISTEWLRSRDGVLMLSGNSIHEGSIPIAQAYAGHQFGYFTMLGDGRAVLLGEQVTSENKRVDVQLKGSGRTPFSRGGDGRAALGPMLREYIISEAMHALKIPTTRSLAVVETGENVYRENILKGAVLTRTASSHIRVGTFQYARNFCNIYELKQLADYAIARHYPHISNEKDKYILFLHEVVKKQAYLIAQWQLTGFIHGVMNTDNMTISGETIDYGPCAFMDVYNPDTVFSSIDTYGRYAYKNQPVMGKWNLFKLADSLFPLIDAQEETASVKAQEIVEMFDKYYNYAYYNGMRAKIGLFEKKESDIDLIDDLLRLMHKHEADYTAAFYELTKLNEASIINSQEFDNWYIKWKGRLMNENRSKKEIKELMELSNPSVIPRNYLVENALKEATENNDYTYTKNLLNALKNPFIHDESFEDYKKLPPVILCPYKTFCGT